MPKGKEILRGVAAAKGEIVATVRIVNGDETKLAKLSVGEVAVADRVDPVDNKYLKKAAAIVTDTGGSWSHGGVAGKLFGIPAVTGTIEATKKLEDGQKVVVDGNEGVVYEYVPGEEAEEKPAPPGGPSLAEKMAAMAAKKGVNLPPELLKKMRQRE